MSTDIYGIKPTFLEVKYDEEDNPYIYYEGVVSVYGKEMKIIIPHLDMSLASLSVETVEETFTGEVNKRLILPSEQTQFYCQPAKLYGEEVYFRIKEERDKTKDFFSW